MSESGYGVAILNDGKYGHGAHENVMTSACCAARSTPIHWPTRASIASPTRSSRMPGTGPRRGSRPRRIALNSRLITVPAGPDTADGPGFVRVEGTELGLGTLKQAFDGDGLVLRVYEPNGARGPVTLRFADPVAAVERVNLLEAPEGGRIELGDGGADGPIRCAAVRSDLASHPEVVP